MVFVLVLVFERNTVTPFHRPAIKTARVRKREARMKTRKQGADNGVWGRVRLRCRGVST